MTNKNDEITFSTLIMSFGTAGLVNLGMIPSNPGEKPEVNLSEARTNIEIIKLLKKKCEGNLSQEEENLVNTILNDLQVKFAQKSNFGQATH